MFWVSLGVYIRDIMISFDVVSLFFDEGILELFCHVLTTSYFTFNAQFYGQTDCVARDSLLSPVIVNFRKPTSIST
jgi:hypothetical protein